MSKQETPPWQINISDKKNMELALFKMFFASALDQGHAISDERHGISYKDGEFFIFDKASQEVTVPPTSLLMLAGKRSIPECLAEWWLTIKFNSISNVVFHKSYDLTSTGITWSWFKNQTLAPMVICTSGSMKRFIERQEHKVADSRNDDSIEI
jgi:hypothetical protein